ncbi:MAG: hypothetical protein MI748_06855 [Opitutales bacterium]|nr:hypothetical protein [Opitutales bacterium]
MKKIYPLCVALFVCCALNFYSLQAWEIAKDAPLLTPWAEDVDPENVLPEYPRPVMVRENWQNLNGIWEFQIASEGEKAPFGKKLNREILVPFPWQSALSGIREHFDSKRAWYRREFEVPSKWKGQRLLLHFGAVDWECKVFVNEEFVGIHRGGFDAFSFEITHQAKFGGKNEIVMEVYDPGNDEAIAVGKQDNKRFEDSGRYTYTPVSGIWQTVWIEPVPEKFIQHFQLIPNIDAEGVQVEVDSQKYLDGWRVHAKVLEAGKVLAEGSGETSRPFFVSLPDPKLWWPDDPHLYDVILELKDEDGEIVDSVESYVGMRKIEIADRYPVGKRGRIMGPVKKILLNGEFVFHMGPLDQGYWPDGLFTAPTDEALKWDVEQTKAWGFNMTRKHIKIEPERWFYWCDKIGLMVWQDMPSTFRQRTEADKAQFEIELSQMVRTHWNHPSIVNWIVFNEHWGVYDVKRLTEWVMELDPSRLVTGNSGIDAGIPDLDYEVGHIKDNHHYRPPTNPFPSNRRAVVNGEYGAIGYLIDGHIWNPNEDEGDWVHFNYEGKDAATAEYEKFVDQLLEFKAEDALSGAVYTQWTDLESEMNGLYTYDRKVEKLHRDRITAANRSLWENDRDVQDLDEKEVDNDLDGGPDTIQ